LTRSIRTAAPEFFADPSRTTGDIARAHRTEHSIDGHGDRLLAVRRHARDRVQHIIRMRYCLMTFWVEVNQDRSPSCQREIAGQAHAPVQFQRREPLPESGMTFTSNIEHRAVTHDRVTHPFGSVFVGDGYKRIGHQKTFSGFRRSIDQGQ
jgi:hypothetical protein